MIKQQQPKVSMNLLWAVAAGLSNRDWRDLTNKEKDTLLTEVSEE